MKTTLLILLLLALAFVLLLFILGLSSKSGDAPGLEAGQLTKCADKPNCVCSEFQADADHFVEPLKLSDNTETSAMAGLKMIIQDLGGQIQTEDSNYLAAVFKSKVFGFVDDLELRLDANGQLIQLRSASRVGYSDGGVNAKRVARIKAEYAKKRAVQE